jgi:hypothetical protein
MKVPKLHLRDWFWVTIAIGAGLAWWADRQHHDDIVGDLADRLRRAERRAEVAHRNAESLLRLHKKGWPGVIE